MGKSNPKKDNKEVEPIPKILPISPPVTKPEVVPVPEKNEPYEPSPEIKPTKNPEVAPAKKQ